MACQGTHAVLGTYGMVIFAFCVFIMFYLLLKFDQPIEIRFQPLVKNHRGSQYSERILDEIAKYFNQTNASDVENRFC